MSGLNYQRAAAAVRAATDNRDTDTAALSEQQQRDRERARARKRRRKGKAKRVHPNSMAARKLGLKYWDPPG